MAKKFNIREWVLSVKYWSTLFIPHVSICLTFITYVLIGASIIQELETQKSGTSSSINNLPRELLVSNLIEKKQLLDAEQFTIYAYKQIIEYENVIAMGYDLEKKSWSFSKSLFFVVTTLTTIGSNNYIPETVETKLFLTIYTGLGIPLTLLFLIDLSFFIKRLIQYVTSTVLYFYSSKIFLHIRRLQILRFLEEKLNISIIVEEEEDDDDDEENVKSLGISSKILKRINEFVQAFRNFDYNNSDLTMKQLLVTLAVYMLIGTCLLSPAAFLDRFYLCFITLFAISSNTISNQEKHLFLLTIYLIFGLAIVLLCVQTVKIRLEGLLITIGKILFQHLLDFSQQIGTHDLSTDDLLPESLVNDNALLESPFFQNRQFTSTLSPDQQSMIRPIGIAAPLRRFSTDFMRAFKPYDHCDQVAHKSVQVTTIIRRCDRCAESPIAVLSSRKHSITSPSSSIAENSSSCEEDDTMDFPPPNLDRVRQRRATMVAKAIISQMAIQPRSSSIDEIISPLTRQRNRSTTPKSSPRRCTIKTSRTPLLEPSRKFDNSQKEFSEIARQISSLLAPSDDEY